MRKVKYPFLLLVLFCSMSINSEELQHHNIVYIGMIKSGRAVGMIGYDVYPEGPVVPLTFAINTNEEVYIPDPINHRLNIFSHDLSLVKIAKEKKGGELHWAKLIEIYNNGNILYLNTSLGLRLIDNDGNELFTLPPQLLDKQIKQYRNIHLINDNIFFYSDKHNLEMISNEGKIETKEKVFDKLKNLSGSQENINFTETIPLPDNLADIIKNIREEKKYIIVGDEFYSNSFKQHQEYYKKISYIREQIKALRTQNNLQPNGNDGTQTSENLNIDDYYHFFVGYDDFHNSYWKFESKKDTVDGTKEIIVIYDKYGEIIDAFQYGILQNHEPVLKQYPTSGAMAAIAPNGDVWFMRGDREAYHFWKVERRW